MHCRGLDDKALCTHCRPMMSDSNIIGVSILNTLVKVNARNPPPPAPPYPGKVGTLDRRTRKKEPMSPTIGQHFHSNGLAFPRLFNNETGYTFQSLVFLCECMVNQAKKSRPLVCNQNRNKPQKQYKCIKLS